MEFKDFLNSPCFNFNNVSLCWHYPFVWSVVTGRWSEFERKVRSAANAKMHHDFSETEIDDAVEQFRYARDLISAEEAEKYLEKFSLTADDLYNFIEHSLISARNTESEDDDDIEAELNYDWTETFNQTLYADGILSDYFSDIARNFAARLAINAIPEKSEVIETKIDQAHLKEVSTIYERLKLPLNASALAYAIQIAERAESNFAQLCENELTEDKLQKTISARRIEWNLIQATLVYLDSDQKAKELMQCVAEDGENIETVTERVNCEVSDFDGTLQELSHVIGEGHADRVFGAKENSLVGPLKLDEVCLVVRLERKSEPTIASDRIRELASNLIIEESLVEIVRRSIVWEWGGL